MEWLRAIALAIVVVLIVAIVVDSVWWYGTQKWPPSPMRIPLLGTPLQFLKFDCETLTENCKRFGAPIYSLHLPYTHFVVLNDWRVMKEAIVDKADVFTWRPQLSFIREMAKHRGILTLDGPQCKEKRRFLLNHFRNSGIGKSIMEEPILEEIAKVTKLIQSQLDGKQATEMEMKDLFLMSALNLLWEIMAGKMYEYDDKDMKDFTEIINENFALAFESFMFNFMPLLKLVPFDPFHTVQLKQCQVRIFEFIERHVDEHARRLKPDREPQDYIDAYLVEIERRKDLTVAAGSQNAIINACYDRSHLMGTIYDILQAGVETTTSTMEWALLYMAIWPEIQTRVQEELDAVIGRNRQPRYTDQMQLPYTRATIMEILRYATVIPFCYPRVAAKTSQLAGYTVPKGTIVFQNLWAVHYDEAAWGDPKNFRPSRFLDENGQVKKFDCYMPYNIGPRVCLGETLARMELFLFFTCMLQAYTFRCITGQRPPSLEPVHALTLKPHAYKLKVIQRS